MNKIIYKLTLALLAAVLLPSTVWADDVLFLFGNGVNLYSQSASTSGYTERTTAPDGRKAIKLKSNSTNLGGWHYIGFAEPQDLSSYSYIHFDVYYVNSTGNASRFKTRLNTDGSTSNTSESTDKGFYWYRDKWTHITLLLDNYKISSTDTPYGRTAITSIGVNATSGSDKKGDVYVANIYVSNSPTVAVDKNGKYVDLSEEVLSETPNAKVCGVFDESTGSSLNSGEFSSIDLTEFYSIDLNNSTPTSTYTCQPTLSNCLVYVSANETFGLTKNVIQNGTCGNLQLTDDTQHAFSAPTAFTATAASLTRTLNEGTYSFVAPFDVTDIPAGITARQFVGIGEGKVTFAKVDAIVANQPYLIDVETTKEYTFTASSVDVPATTEGEETHDGFTFKAVMTPTAAGDITGSYVLDAEGAGFRKATSTTRVGSMRAYLQGSGGEARLGIFYNDDLVTAIQSVAPAAQPAGVYYNLNGQRVAQPAKGLYVRDGKKMIVK